jgi:hypothetical protein
MRKIGDAVRMRNNIRRAKSLMVKPTSVGELAFKLNITYNQALHLARKMLKAGALSKVGDRYKLSNKDEEIQPMPIFIEREINGEMMTISREQAKEVLMSEMLDVWQPLAAIALRCGIHRLTAKNILTELERELKVKSSTFRLDGHNKSLSYKKTSYVKVMGVFMPVQQESEYVI